MIICVCNRISEKQIYQSCAKGNLQRQQVLKDLQHRERCGKCNFAFDELLLAYCEENQKELVS